MELLLLLPFLMGWVVGSVQSYYPEKAKVQKLVEELKWSQAKVKTQQLDLDRWAAKNQEWAKEMVQGKTQDWPRANSYWRFEGPKLQQRVLDLEMELDRLRSQTLWKQD